MRYRSAKFLPRFAACVAGAAAATGALAQPKNDVCVDATLLAAGVPAAGTTVDAGLDLTVTCAGDAGDVWYAFTPKQTGAYLFAATGESNFNLSLAIISSCDFPIAEFACSTGLEAGPRIEIQLFAGSPVLVRVGSAFGQSFTVSAQNAPPPANDECAGAIPLSLGVPQPANNLSATTSLELNNQSLCSSNAPGLGGGADVFFSFTPDADGYYDFSTCGSQIDTVVSIHSACPVSAANAIACNDNAPLPACPEPFDTYSSYVAGAQLSAGVTYYVRVAGVRIFNPFTGELEGPGRGSFEVTVLTGVAPVVPANDTCATAEVLLPNSQAFGTTVNATSDLPATCGGDDTWDVWYDFTSDAASRTSFQFTIDPGAFNTQATLSAFDGCSGERLVCQAFNPLSNPEMTIWIGLEPGQNIKIRVAGQQGTQDQFTLTATTGGPAAENVSCETAQPVTAGEVVMANSTGANSGLASVCGFNDIYPLWYSFTTVEPGYYRFATNFPADPKSFDRTTLALSRDCAASSVVCTQQGDQFSDNPAAAALALFVEAGETIYARASYEAPVRGPFEFSVSGPLPPPPPVTNDSCATATTIGAMPYALSLDITLATPDQDVCVVEGQPLVATPAGVWFSFTPDVERVFRGSATVASTGNEARISVFTGPCSSLTQVGCPADGFPGGGGLVLNAGTTYFFLVSLAPFSEGEVDEIPYGTTIDLTFVALPRPANDDCNTAQRITSSSTTISVNTLPADADAPMPSCIGNNGALENAVWYTFTPTTAGTVTVEGRGSNPMEGLYSPGGVLYSGPCDALVEVACDSPLNGFFITREFSFTAELEAGVTYSLAVGSWARAMGGDTEIEFSYTGEIGCASDFNDDGQSNSQDFFDFLTAFFASAPAADFNADGQINSQDFFDFLTAFFAGCD